MEVRLGMETKRDTAHLMTVCQIRSGRLNVNQEVAENEVNIMLMNKDRLSMVELRMTTADAAQLACAIGHAITTTPNAECNGWITDLYPKQ